MSDALEGRQLGGIARSIDALFRMPVAPEAGVERGGAEEHTAASAEILEVRDPVVLELVDELGRARDEDRRQVLTAACVSHGVHAAEVLGEALARTDDRFARRAYVEALVALGGAAGPVMEGMVQDPRWYVARNGISVLAEVGGTHAIEWLTGALARSEAKVRREALLALARIGGEDAGQLASGMLRDPDVSVRIAAATAVGQLGTQRAMKTLVVMLEEEDDPDLIIAVLHALGQLRDPAAVHAIERHAVATFLRRIPADVRIAAYGALRKIWTPHARRLLNQAVDDRDVAVKAEVRNLLGM
jgi:HEAT repeat protein